MLHENLTNTTAPSKANPPEANTTQASLLESAIEAAYEKASEYQRNRDYLNAIYYFLEALRGEFNSPELIDAAQIAVNALREEINKSGSSQGQENIGPKQNYIGGCTAYRSNRLFSEKTKIKAATNNNNTNISATNSDAEDTLNPKLQDVDQAIINIKNRLQKNPTIHKIDHLLNQIEANYFPKKSILPLEKKRKEPDSNIKLDSTSNASAENVNRPPSPRRK